MITLRSSVCEKLTPRNNCILLCVPEAQLEMFLVLQKCRHVYISLFTETALCCNDLPKSSYKYCKYCKFCAPFAQHVI